MLEDRKITASIGTRTRKIFKSEYSVLFVLIILCIVISIVTPRFADITNLLNIIKRTSITGIAAIGMTFVIATGGIDLSVGGQVCVVSVLGTLMLMNGYPSLLVVITMIVIAAAIGAFNGILITRVKLAPFMATLAMLGITRGMAFYITKGKTLFDIPEAFGKIGLGSWLNIPIPAIIYIVVAAIAIIILKRFTLGRRILAVGGNANAAWYSGINIKTTVLIAYIISGISAGISSVILLSRLLSASPSMGIGLELDAIAAVVIGGTSLSGGNGYVIGSVAGALVIEVIANWMNLAAVDPFLREVAKGVIILIALTLDVIRKGRFSKSEIG